jgi:hypothetical protein
LHDALQLRFGIILFSLLDRNCRATSGDLNVDQALEKHGAPCLVLG